LKINCFLSCIVFLVILISSPVFCFEGSGQISFGFGFKQDFMDHLSFGDLGISLDLQVMPDQVPVDVYFGLIDPHEEIFYGKDWDNYPQPIFRNHVFHHNRREDSEFMESAIREKMRLLDQYDCDGRFSFVMFATRPNSFDMVSNISSESFYVGYDDSKDFKKYRSSNEIIESFFRSHHYENYGQGWYKSMKHKTLPSFKHGASRRPFYWDHAGKNHQGQDNNKGHKKSDKKSDSKKGSDKDSKHHSKHSNKKDK
jgi:hypothetical protein